MSFKLSKKSTIFLGLVSVVIIFTGYFAYIEAQNRISPTPTPSHTPTEYPNNPSTPQVTSYTVTIPEIYRVSEHVGLGFGRAEINLKFIAPSSSLQNEQNISEVNFTTTKLPITLTANQNNSTNSILPAIINGTTIYIKVDVYQYTMIVDNPRILVASKEWNETKYVYG